MKTSRFFPLLAALLGAGAGAPLAAFEPGVLKLQAKNAVSGDQFGAAVAASAKYLLIGQPGFDGGASDGGAVLVHDARTGKFLRRLVPDDVTASALVGSALALSGDLAVVGSQQDDEVAVNAGAAYVFDLRNGRQLRKLTVSTGTTNDFFGSQVAMSGDFAAIIASGQSGGRGLGYVFNARTGEQLPAAFQPPVGVTFQFGTGLAMNGRVVLAGNPVFGAAGEVYVFDAFTGELMKEFNATGNPPGIRFGASVALFGHHAVIGAPGAASGQGAVYLCDLRAGINEVRIFTAPDAVAGEELGRSVAVEGNLLLAGAPASAAQPGRVLAFNLATGQRLSVLSPEGVQPADGFGAALALAGETALVGAPLDDKPQSNAGAASLIRPLADTLAGTVLARAGNSAPGAPEAQFASFQEAVIDLIGKAVFTAALKGGGAGGGRNRGLWSQLGTGETVDLALRSKDALDGLGADFTGTRAAALSAPVSHFMNRAVFTAALTGAGVKASNNRALLLDDGSSLSPLLRTGFAPAHLPGTQTQSFAGALQSALAFNALAAIKLKQGVGGVEAANDSALLHWSLASVPAVVLTGSSQREGGAAAGSGTLGEIDPRAAITPAGTAAFVWQAAVIPDGGGAAVRRVFTFNGATNSVSLTSGGVFAGSTTVQTFPALACAVVSPLVHATLAGGGATPADNEAILLNGITPLARKGDDLGAGLRIGRFLQFSPANGLSNALVLLVKLAGTGVNSSNDLAVVLRQSTNGYRILVREGGEVLIGADPVFVKTIQRLTVDPLTGGYAVLASLSGPAGRNQALLTGDTSIGNDSSSSPLRQARLSLRKGALTQNLASGLTTRLRSLSFTTPLAPDGSISRGQGRAVRAGRIVLQAQFDKGAKLLLRRDL